MEKRMYTAFLFNASYDCDENTIHIVEWNENFGGFTSMCGVDGEQATQYKRTGSSIDSWTEGWRKLRKGDYGRMECKKCHNTYFHGGEE